MTLGNLCDLLIQANIYIYKYENLKWWGRKKKKASSNEINKWDKLSRTWNEKRSLLKNQIDNLLKQSLANKKKAALLKKITTPPQEFSFQILPISLMIDMLTIENIKIYDLTNKNNKAAAKKAKSRVKVLKKNIDKALRQVFISGDYSLEEETRTF